MPLQIALEESKNKIIQSINDVCAEYNLNYYFLEIIVKELYNEILQKKEIELNQIKEEYKNSLKESEK